MRFYFFILCFVWYLQSNAQGWRSRFYLPNTQNNTSQFIYETTPGNYITGGAMTDSNGINCLSIMGLGANGQLLWKKRYGNANFKYIDNNYVSHWAYKQGNYIYYTCGIRDSNYTNHNIDMSGTYVFGALLKIDFNGDTVWQKTYRDSTQDIIPQQVTSSVDGGFLITGFFQNWNNHTAPCLLIKTDANGNELWRKAIHKNVPDVMDGRGIVQDSASKKIAVIGYQYIGNANGWDTFDNILILDSLGNKLVQTHFTSNTWGGLLSDLIQAKDGKLIAVGTSIYGEYNGSNATKAYAVKFDINNLSKSWSILYDWVSPSADFRTIIELPNEDLVISGVTDTSNMHNLLIQNLTQLMKVSKDGTILSNRYYNYYLPPDILNIRAINCLSSTSDGGLVASIREYMSMRPFLFVKYDESGCDSTLAYCASNYTWTSIKKLIIEDLQITIYPNPANDIVIVELPQRNKYNIKLNNMLGVICREISLTEEKTEINVSTLNAGIYFLHIYEGGNLMATQKVIKE